MKIIKNILLFILPLLAMFSCTECWETNIINDGKLSTTISVEIPQLFDTQSQTRAMGEKPDLKNLYLAVFDKNGYLMDYVQAELEQTQGQVSGKYNYKVSLTPTSEKTIVHFIGNAPTNISFGSEVQIISSLYTTGGEEAYWQRIEFANGINETSAVPNVVLIRNFAWIDLIDGADNFKIDSYCVMNTYDKGSIAPYNTKEGKGWITNYKDQTYEKLTGTPEFYNGFIPAEAELSNDIPDKSDEPLPNIHFVYEREKSLSGNHPYILIKGFYNNSTEPSYYRVDLRDDNGNYFPIIRNFKYSITIKEVKHAGYETPALASTSPGSGDVSINPRYQPFTNISNGVVRLYVDYTNITLVEQQDALILKYKFVYPDGTSLTNATVTVDKDASVEDAGDAIDGNPSITKPSEDGNWGEITIATTAPGERLKTQDVIVKGAVTIDGVLYELQRRVTINVRQRPKMILECNPSAIASVQGSPFDLFIKVPLDLGSSMFPLEFQIEAEEQSITPDRGDNLPVITGKSIILNSDGSPSDKIAIGFLREVSYTEYIELVANSSNNLASIPCKFKSNKAISATNIYVQNKYFERNAQNNNYQSVYLANYNQKNFTHLSFNPVFLPTQEDELVLFSFTMPTGDDAPEYILVTLNNLEPANPNDNFARDPSYPNAPVYKYKPSPDEKANGSITLNLLTMNSTSQSATVTLSADRFADASAAIYTDKVIIPAGHIKVGDISNITTSSVTFTLFSKNPTNSTNNNNNGSLGKNFTAQSGGSNSDGIEISKTQYNNINADNSNTKGKIYIRFDVTTWSGWYQTRTYYVAEVELAKLLANGVTLYSTDFEPY